MEDISLKLKEFVENEMRSCSMDIGGITPEYVYRMLGGKFSMVDIENGLREIRKLPNVNDNLYLNKNKW